MPTPAPSTERLTIRLAPELRTALEEAAAAEERSLNNYVLRVLRRAVGMKPKKKAAR